jgi:hypothetical protein
MEEEMFGSKGQQGKVTFEKEEEDEGGEETKRYVYPQNVRALYHLSINSYNK